MPTAELTTFTNDGLTFRVVDSGPRDGEPVVLLHGFPQGPASWDQVSSRLHDAGYRTIVPEQRGYSPGARPRRRRDYRGALLVGDIIALLDALDAPSVHLVGHDWGAAVAWGVAGRHPDRVRSLTAVSVCHPGAFIKSMTRSNQLLKSWYMGLFQIPVVPERVLAMRSGAARRIMERAGMDGPMIERYFEQFPGPADFRGPVNWYRALPLASRRDLRARIPVPTTMVYSDDDVALTLKSAQLAEEYVDGPYRLVVLPGVSHWIPEHAPDELAGHIIERARSAG